ncbi:DUF732 domain-containing protein [Mycobacterium bourgelatii]|uniref:DUF732 domain-containing protein n=1 Tax=Mycobacterium bourgelatii TaxID=1273442 RepID=A0A7I9YJN3_MYCBU|nr:DUF732 domain-containing protein [Mycobacterium bourgelatii]MCV6973597.1 DUF732 domain-containing protein [Mycobacterium bourgelatii]GFG88829.1 hypothetical protein MBOU_08710 [Mycobacterium bourgelatii]
MKLWRNQPLTIRLLTASAGVLAASAVFAAAPAEASPVDDAFINALNNAGINYGDALNAEALGQSVCPILSQPGGSFNKAASTVVARQSGMNQGMAEMFTSIAIASYCPQVMANVANGSLPDSLQQIPGVGQIPGLADLPGLPGF